jgi:hypothetical protein
LYIFYLQQTYGKRAVGRPGTDGKMQYGRTVINYLERKHGKQRPRTDSFGGNA